MAKYH